MVGQVITHAFTLTHPGAWWHHKACIMYGVCIIVATFVWFQCSLHQCFDVAVIIAVMSEGVGLVAVAVVAVFGSCLLLLLLGSGVVTYPSSGGR